MHHRRISRRALTIYLFTYAREYVETILSDPFFVLVVYVDSVTTIMLTLGINRNSQNKLYPQVIGNILNPSWYLFQASLEVKENLDMQISTFGLRRLVEARKI